MYPDKKCFDYSLFMKYQKEVRILQTSFFLIAVIFGNVKKHEKVYIKLYRRNINKKHMKIHWNKKLNYST